MTPFFITGLPRSRTAWLASFFTTDKSLVFHDVPVDTHKDYVGKQIGFSSPEYVDIFTPLRLKWPQSKWLVVLRDPKTSLESFRKWSENLIPKDFDLEHFWRERMTKLDNICLEDNVMAVFYDRLDDEKSIMAIWKFLLPEIPFDKERWEVFKRLNIQQYKGGS